MPAKKTKSKAPGARQATRGTGRDAVVGGGPAGKRAAQKATPRAGSAGRRGDGVRSDVFVAVESAASGGCALDVTSKADSLVGGLIRGDAERVLQAFGVEHARITIEDKGALPFVLAARVETALSRAGFEGDGRPERTTRIHPADKDTLRRSRLYLPGNEPKFMVNAGLHRPDGIILDLEDSVHPGEKDAARILVRNALRCVDFFDAERMVRINPLPLGFDDLDAVVPEGPHVILIPKVEHAETVRQVDQRVRHIQESVGEKRPIWLMPILETALGIENAFDIAGAVDTVVAMTIGLEDYTADLGAPKTAVGDESLYARRRLVNAARAASVQAIDSVYGNVGDMAGMSAWARRARAMGFEGMGCVHPRQIRPIHEAFAPSPEEIERASEIVAAFDAATAKGLSVVSLGTRMIDPPVVLRAQRLVAAARRAGLIEEGGDDRGK